MKKTKNSIERYNIDVCLENMGGNRFQMILATATRAREIATQRTFQDRNGVRMAYENKPTVEALCELADGKYGKEYLNKLK